MDRDELVERVAEEIGRNSPCEMSLDYAKSLARAALAIIEPAVREECARVAERRWRDWPGIHPDDAKNGEVCDDVTACADIASAIRAGAKPS